MKPAEALKRTIDMARQLEAMSRKAVFVGLPNEAVGGKIYGDDMSVMRVGAIHEFGYGPIPQRSFLRAPFSIKRKEINDAIAKQFEKATNGGDVDRSLGLIGVAAMSISKGAFTSLGYGSWTPIQPETAAHKGSGQTLVDTRTLRNSITWVIR